MSKRIASGGVRKERGTIVPGKVYLVGAGPGDPGLLTLRGRECLRRADLVLYDGLVNPLLLRHTAAEAQRTCRAGGPEGGRLPQSEVNARLVEAALAGRTVVRLKGGDPFLFGRGGEEVAALVAAGVEFEIVPGVTAALAAGAATGIPLTHRDLASAVAFVTGHEDPEKSESLLDYAELARFPGSLVFYMGLHRLEAIADALVAAGKSPATPACVVSRATWPDQRTVTAPLGGLAAAVRRAGLVAPSVAIVGECVALRDRLAWFERRPLSGRSIGITRAEGQSDETIARCLELGGEPVLVPSVRIEPPEDLRPVDAVLARLAEFDWIVFTSANGVRGLLDRLWSTGGDARRLGRARIATIGPSTAEALHAYGLRSDVVPPSFRAESLAEALRSHVKGRRVLWARASRGRDVLPEELAAAGAQLEQVVVYRNLDAEALPDAVRERILAGRLDWIGLSSPSIARTVAGWLDAPLRATIGTGTRLASISPVTTAAAHECGLPIAAEATEHTWEGIFAAIADAERAAKR